MVIVMDFSLLTGFVVVAHSHPLTKLSRSHVNSSNLKIISKVF